MMGEVMPQSALEMLMDELDAEQDRYDANGSRVSYVMGKGGSVTKLFLDYPPMPTWMIEDGGL